jgi:hypothetical protein
MKVIYICGPYRDTRGEYFVKCNIDNAERAALFVWSNGGVALCPHKNTSFLGGACPDEVWLKGDIELLSRCDGLYAVPGFNKSKGAMAEIEFAKKNNIPIFYQQGALQEFIK